MKFYRQVNRRYLYLNSDTAETEEDSTNTYNMSYTFKIPTQNIINSEISVFHIASENTDVNKNYVIRICNLHIENVFDSIQSDPILYIDKGLDRPTAIDYSPKLKIKNTTFDRIKLKISPDINEIDRDDGILITDMVYFVIGICIEDFEPEERSFSYNFNDKQNNAKPNYIY